MKIKIEINGEVYEAEGFYLPSVVEEVAREAGLLEDDETVHVLNSDQAYAADKAG